MVKLSSDGVTILFSTHVLEIAQAICQRVTILDKGNIIAEGNIEELRARAGGSTLESIFLNLTGSTDVRAIVEELTARHDNFRKARRVLQVPLLSQQTAATARNVRSFIRRPMALVVLDVVAFAVASGVSYVVGNALAASPQMASMTATYLRSALITIPALTVFGIILVFGLVLEVSGGSQFAASDTINWLPVSAGEYVLGSITSLIAYYSVIPAIVIGATLPISYTFGLLSIWELVVVFRF